MIDISMSETTEKTKSNLDIMFENMGRITKAGAKWYELVNRGHHKDRDCHFYIETVWSYGNPPKYHAKHYGYCSSEFDVVFYSYMEAVGRMADKLEKMVKQEETKDEFPS